MWFVDSSGTDLTEDNYSQLIMNQPLQMQVRISVRDPMNAVHHYTPKLTDRVQMLVTDIQNCPFVQLPMKITANKEDVNPTTFIWDLLKYSVTLRATEVHLMIVFYSSVLKMFLRLFCRKITLPLAQNLC